MVGAAEEGMELHSRTRLQQWHSMGTSSVLRCGDAKMQTQSFWRMCCHGNVKGALRALTSGLWGKILSGKTKWGWGLCPLTLPCGLPFRRPLSLQLSSYTHSEPGVGVGEQERAGTKSCEPRDAQKNQRQCPLPVPHLPGTPGPTTATWQTLPVGKLDQDGVQDTGTIMGWGARNALPVDLGRGGLLSPPLVSPLITWKAHLVSSRCSQTETLVCLRVHC